MKCLKHVLTNEVIRVADDKVADIIKGPPFLWDYCPKSEWKAKRLTDKAA